MVLGLEGYITGKTGAPEVEVEEKGTDGKMIKVPTPAYEEWYARDQQILGFLFTSVTKDVLSQITAAKKAAQAWSAVENMFTAQTRARSMNMRLALTTTKKGSMTIAEYFGKMRSLSDEMAAAGKQLDEKEIVVNILNGLDGDLNPVMSALVTRAEPISVGEVYAQLLSFETRLEFEDGTGASVNSANRGRGGSSVGHGGAGCGTSGGRGNQGPGAGRGKATSNNAPTPATSEDKEAQVTVILFARSASSGVIWLRIAGITTLRIMSPTNAWSQQL